MGNHWGTTGEPQGNYRGTTGELQGNHRGTTRELEKELKRELEGHSRE